ncbi:tyrosine-type recombinase/integrase [Hyphobacterium sp. CCMP332]|nr:tyrosine-type recombinase/integrase [Hyphobacterium sp. CCMP332]
MKRYSSSTIETYTSMFKGFLKYFVKRKSTDWNEKDAQEYLEYLVRTRKISRSYQNQCINAIKFYLEQVCGKPRTTYYFERPQKQQRIPKVMNADEIRRLLSQVRNLKHRTMLFVVYSGGLRISEVCKLKINDIDSENMFIKIRAAKGQKDRTTLLSQKCLEQLRKYFKVYQPENYLFPGQYGGPYSPASLRQVFNRAKNQARLDNDYTVHTLRHSFATHLVEQHVNLRYIQTLLGHSSSRTTEIYTHIAQMDLRKIESPLDRIDFGNDRSH